MRRPNRPAKMALQKHPTIAPREISTRLIADAFGFPTAILLTQGGMVSWMAPHVPIRAISEELVPGFAEPDAAVI